MSNLAFSLKTSGATKKIDAKAITQKNKYH